MRKISFLLLSILLITACGKKHNIEIIGNYPAASGEVLSAELLNINQTQFIDSVKINKSGKFQLKIDLEEPELVLLKNNFDEYINLLVFPDDRIRLDIADGNFASDYEISGSAESEKIKSLVNAVAVSRFELDSISKAYDAVENKESPEAAVLVDAYRNVIQNQKRHNIRFVIENINSLASVYALYQRITPDIYVLNEVKDLQYFKIVSDSISVKYPGSTLARSLANDVETKLTNYNRIVAINRLAEQSEMKESGIIELDIPNIEDKEISLSSLKGNVVLLNFWASWDSDSRQATNALKGIYNKYHKQGFEIYSVGLENNLTNWRSAIDYEEYNWINVSELSYPYSFAANAYNVQNLPTNYLIDRGGNIVAKNLSGKLLATWLDNLL